MKIFDYKCGECDTIYEVFLRSDTIPKCTSCGSESEQQKQLSFAMGYATNDDSPKTQRDLANYFGNGQYKPGYKKE